VRTWATAAPPAFVNTDRTVVTRRPAKRRGVSGGLDDVERSASVDANLTLWEEVVEIGIVPGTSGTGTETVVTIASMVAAAAVRRSGKTIGMTDSPPHDCAPRGAPGLELLFAVRIRWSS
jgi:hypothetical protein